jgi:aminotransferase
MASACDAIVGGHNQYADMRGHQLLREAIVRSIAARPRMQWVDPDLNVSVTCGATEAMAVSLLAVAGPGDEVVVQVPSYENYRPQILLTGASVKYLVTNPPDWKIEVEALEACFSAKTKAIIINQPNNPTGRVFSAEELMLVATYASRYGSWVLSDEIY